MGRSHSKQTVSSTMAEKTERQAQVAVDHCKHLINLKLKLAPYLITKWICGCDITTTGTILLTDHIDKCLIGIDTKGNHLFTISTAPYRAFDVKCIDDTTAAITGDKVIRIVDISSRFVKKHIDVGYDCYGVTHRDGKLFICARGHGIMSINLTKDMLTTIVHCDDLPFDSYITTYKDKLYYTNYKSMTVTCCDMESNTIWIFKDANVIRSPRGITTDNEGRVYVCDKVKSQVIVLSNDGKQSKTIISEADGLNVPYAIHFDKKRNSLLIANGREKVFLFNLVS